MLELIRRRWNAARRAWAPHPGYWNLTPQHSALLGRLRSALGSGDAGRVLDAGAGLLVHRALFSEASGGYVSLDAVKTHSDLDVAADAGKMPFEDAGFDTVLCSQVLEHVEEPDRVLEEIVRVLKPGGRLIATVPHLSPLHGEPADFHRFTRHGLELRLRRAGLRPLSIEPTAGLLTFLSSQVFLPVSALLAPVPGAGAVWVACAGIAGGAIVAVDRLFSSAMRLFPLDYVAAAEKSAGAPGPR